tara:strand:+ start:97463 stop:98206 length:744 start_codon:yes stop_codon:yes gene_type:complete
MLQLSDFHGRLLRTDKSETLGTPTHELAVKAIKSGETELAETLIKTGQIETKSLHDLFCDWVWELLTRTAERCGETGMYQILRSSQETWMMRRTWKVFRNLSVKRQVDLTAEMMRSHRCGPGQTGEIKIKEDKEKFSIVMDPCGSGGRMRRGDVEDGTPSRLGAPYNFGVTKEKHYWSWGKKSVPYYCVHCAVNEILPIEWGGYPLWVTEYNEDASKPCQWLFYKEPELIPEIYWTRLGKKKPQNFK